MAKSSGKKKKRDRGLLTSLHVAHPKMLVRIKKAAKLKDESISKFLITAGDKEAAHVLGGNCPNCGAPLKKDKPAKKAA